MKKEEVQVLMCQLELVFDVVRLVDAELMTQFSVDASGEIRKEPYRCYAFWNKQIRCENCISAKTLACKQKMTKFEFVNNNVYHVLAMYLDIDGAPYVLEAVSAITDETLFGAFGKNKFIETITEYNRKLYIDPVTGAHNRQYYEEQLRGLKNANAVAILDMDNFKCINDTYGHFAGDCALKAVADILLSYSERTGAVVRYGGDEFLMIFINISRELFSDKLEEIRKAVCGIVLEDYPKIRLSVSVGGVYGTGETETMLRKADAMLYEAKVTKDSVRTAERHGAVKQNRELLVSEGKALSSQKEKAVQERRPAVLTGETDMVYTKERLTYVSYHDTMTGLGNRNKYMDFCRVFERNPSDTLGLAVLDIRHLSDINRSMGTEYGDRALRETADCIKSCFTSEQAFRIGDDEFVIVVMDCPREQFIGNFHTVQNKIRSLTFGDVSCVCVWEKHPESVEEIFCKADKLLCLEKNEHDAKSAAGNAGRKAAKWLSKLSEELQSERFVIYLQPQFDISEGNRLCGAEALVRRIDDNGQIVLPKKFISCMEREGAISYLDFAVFEKVCRMIGAWNGKNLHPNFRIAVNFSRITLARPDFLTRIEEIRRNADVSPSQLEVEMTETQEILSESSVQAALQSLQRAGYAVSLDDFGSGNSSVENIVLFSWDFLKFDMKLIQSLPTSEQMSVLLSYLCEYGRKYGISCVAEGVETEEQLEAVKGIGFRKVQGYYFDVPIPIADFEKKYLKTDGTFDIWGRLTIGRRRRHPLPRSLLGNDELL